MRPEKFVLTFFGGEPLLNLPVMYYLAERLWAATQARGVKQITSIITNGLLLTEEVVDRLVPFGLKGVKITLDGDRDTHNRMRPLRGGQGTFDRIIENMRRIAGKCQIAIGGNFDDSSVDSYPALLEFLKSRSSRTSSSRSISNRRSVHPRTPACTCQRLPYRARDWRSFRSRRTDRR